jgi:putative transposase
MTTLPLPIQFLAAWIATWMARHQERVIDYLKEEDRVLREKLGGRTRLTAPERRRLAKLGYELGRTGLRDVACIASPDTILRWYRELVAKKYDGSTERGPARPGSHPRSCGFWSRWPRKIQIGGTPASEAP